jgi:glycosyltransferase involved in cell wall biosynthesis
MKSPLFSIIIPIYGVEKYLPKCLDSIINQSFKDFEAILVNDGVKDNCPEICRKYASNDPRLKVIIKENEGLVSARQAGVQVAHGEYAVCIDGDDWIGNDYLTEFAQIIEQHNPDVVICGRTNAKPNGNTKQATGYRTGFYSKKDIERYIFPSLIETKDAKYFPKTLWAKVFKLTAYQQQQQQLINKILNLGEDSACVIPIIYNAHTLYISDSCEYFYRINQTSMTKNRKPFATDGPRIIHEHICSQIDLNQFGFREQLYRKTTHEVFSVVKSLFNKRQSYWKTRKEILEVLKEPTYDECIKKCHFKGSIAALIMQYTLRYHLTLPIYLFNKLT